LNGFKKIHFKVSPRLALTLCFKKEDFGSYLKLEEKYDDKKGAISFYSPVL
jgi:hypothetical protein